MKDWHSTEDLKRLDDSLMALPELSDAMLLPEFDGFCAALLVCPEMIWPSEWLPQVWGANGPPEFDSAEQMQDLLDLLMAHYNRVAQMLMPPAYYGPVIEEVVTTGEVMWEMWMEGFMSAVALLRPDAWRHLTRGGDDHALTAMSSMMSLSRFARKRIKYSSQERAERDAGAANLIIDCVLEFNRFTKGLPTASPLHFVLQFSSVKLLPSACTGLLAGNCWRRFFRGLFRPEPALPSRESFQPVECGVFRN